MIAEGRITIDLDRDGGVRLHSNRGADVGALLRGREPDEVIQLLPMLFSLCGRAHVAAARLAMCRPLNPDIVRRDALLILAENAREHLLRILTGWHMGDGPALPAAPVMRLVDAMQAAQNPQAERTEAARLSQFLTDHVLGVTPKRFLALDSLAELQDWLRKGQTTAQRYLANILNRGWQAFGASKMQPLPALPPKGLTARLAEQNFAARPDWAGQPCETGPLAREVDHPLIRAITAEHGAGLLARLVARLVELARIPGRMRDPAMPEPGPDGLGIVETARGRLIHAARLKDGRIASYRILAPTEWNFHPDGAAVRSLQNAQRDADLAQRAEALVAAIDPCVAFDVRVA